MENQRSKQKRKQKTGDHNLRKEKLQSLLRKIHRDLQFKILKKKKQTLSLLVFFVEILSLCYLLTLFFHFPTKLLKQDKITSSSLLFLPSISFSHCVRERKKEKRAQKWQTLRQLRPTTRRIHPKPLPFSPRQITLSR